MKAIPDNKVQLAIDETLSDAMLRAKIAFEDLVEVLSGLPVSCYNTYVATCVLRESIARMSRLPVIDYCDPPLVACGLVYRRDS